MQHRRWTLAAFILVLVASALVAADRAPARQPSPHYEMEIRVALARAFSALPEPPLHGVLIRSREDPTVFYSFGPWRSEDHIASMRADPGARQAIAAVVEVCETATPGSYSLVRQVSVG